MPALDARPMPRGGKRPNTGPKPRTGKPATAKRPNPRLDPDERARLDRLATKLGVTPAEATRIAIAEKCDREGV